ncbi:MAG TPA: hypothetical protein VF381_12755 [Thermoanaerobaculia bacterium]
MTKPCCENIPSLATASLSITGGESYSTIRDYNWKGLISFEEASAYATGSMDHGAYNTLSTVTVKNLNVANMVHADLLVARVTSKHLPGAPEGEITFTGSMIRNLVVAGREVDVVLDESPFTRYPTYAGFATQAADFHDEESNVISCSLAVKVGDHEGFTIHIPEFGTIYVAQIIMKPSYRRISMLRFRLGCPIGGTAELGGAESNGVEYWP